MVYLYSHVEVVKLFIMLRINRKYINSILKIIKFLFIREINRNIYKTINYLTIMYGHLGILKFFIQQDSRYIKDINLAVQRICKYGNLEIVKFLL